VADSHHHTARTSGRRVGLTKSELERPVRPEHDGEGSSSAPFRGTASISGTIASGLTSKETRLGRVPYELRHYRAVPAPRFSLPEEWRPPRPMPLGRSGSSRSGLTVLAEYPRSDANPILAKAPHPMVSHSPRLWPTAALWARQRKKTHVGSFARRSRLVSTTSTLRWTSPESPPLRKTKRIVSYHNVKGRPSSSQAAPISADEIECDLVQVATLTERRGRPPDGPGSRSQVEPFVRPIAWST